MTLPNFGEPESDDTLDRFLGQRLHIAGVWSSPRVGDGIARVRVMERTPDRVRLLGLIWLVESQLQAPFWLDLTEPAGGRFAWTLHFGLVSLVGRSHRDLQARRM